MVGPPGPYAQNLQAALSRASTMRSTFNWNYTADQFNITPGVPKLDVDGFIRDRAIKAYHNNDVTGEIYEDDYTKAHYNMADEMIQTLRYGNRSWSYNNMDQESIDNRVYSLDDPIVTGRPTTGSVIENPLIRQEIYIGETKERNRPALANLVPSKPFAEHSAPGYTLREFDNKKWREFERDGMQKYNNRLIKRDGSAQDTYDVGAPAILAFSGYRGLLDYDNIAEPGKMADMSNFAKTNPMFGDSDPISESGIQLSDMAMQAVSRILLWPGGLGDFVYEIPEKELDNIPIRAMALLRVLDGANVHDFNNMLPSQQLELNGRITELVNRFYQSRPELLMDQDFNDAMSIFSKQVNLDPVFGNLDPVNTMASNDQYQNILTQMNIAPATQRAASFDHTVDMGVQQEVALSRYGNPYNHTAKADFEFPNNFDNDISMFADIQAIMFPTPNNQYTPIQGIDSIEVHEVGNKGVIMHPNNSMANINMGTTISTDRVESTNGGGRRQAPASIYRQQSMATYDTMRDTLTS